MNFELEFLSKAKSFYLLDRISHSLVSENFLVTHMPVVTPQIGMESNREKSIISNKGNWGEKFGAPLCYLK